MKFLIVLLCMNLKFVVSIWDEYIIIIQKSIEPETRYQIPPIYYTLPQRQQLCQFLRNAEVFVEVEKILEFLKWTNYEVGLNINGIGQQSEVDGKVLDFFLEEGEHLKTIRCDYGMSQVFLIAYGRRKPYFVIYKISGESGVLFAFASFEKSFEISDCPYEYYGLYNFERNDRKLFINIFQKRVLVTESTEIGSGETINLPVEDSLTEAVASYTVNDVERRVLNLSESRKMLLCASIFRYLSKRDGTQSDKVIPIMVSVGYMLDEFSFLPGIIIISFHCIQKISHKSFNVISVVPHPSQEELIFVVSNKGTYFSVEQLFCSRIC